GENDKLFGFQIPEIKWPEFSLPNFSEILEGIKQKFTGSVADMLDNIPKWALPAAAEAWIEENRTKGTQVEEEARMGLDPFGGAGETVSRKMDTFGVDAAVSAAVRDTWSGDVLPEGKTKDFFTKPIAEHAGNIWNAVKYSEDDLDAFGGSGSAGAFKRHNRLPASAKLAPVVVTADVAKVLYGSGPPDRGANSIASAPVVTSIGGDSSSATFNIQQKVSAGASDGHTQAQRRGLRGRYVSAPAGGGGGW
ncbi:MAG: hypothetical protein GY893_00040, partial [bacterium]|nr:hypothetical protein [bacterium]